MTTSSTVCRARPPPGNWPRMATTNSPRRIDGLRKGIDLRGCRALANRRHDLASAIGRHSARVYADPYRISGNGHQSRLLDRVCGGGAGTKYHVPPAQARWREAVWTRDCRVRGAARAGLARSRRRAVSHRRHANWPDDRVRGIAFACVVAGNLASLVVNRSPLRDVGALMRIPNRAQWWVLGGTFVALAAVLSLPALRRIFHFSPIRVGDTIYPAMVGASVMAWSEMLKRWQRPRRDRRHLG